MFAVFTFLLILAQTFEAGAQTSTARACRTCKYVVPVDKSVIDGKELGFRPGDVICLNANVRYGNLTFKNLNGTEKDPVILMNCGGEVTIDAPGKPFSLKVADSKHFRITGGNVSGVYGIKLTGSMSNGLVLGPFATDFVVDHIEAFDVGFSGIMAKTDPNCNEETHRGNFTMRNIAFHNNYIHDTGGECFYIGHTGFNGAKTACGTQLPHTIENVEIHHNLVRNSGWDGIQLSSATVGASIHHNVVENYSTKQKRNQSGGICVSSGTGGVCHSNIIKGGYGPGIVVFGIGENYIYNNIIVNSGAMGIFCDDRTEVGSGFYFLNNTIINPGLEGIRLYADQVPVNVLVNNIVVNPGYITPSGKRADFFSLRKTAKVDTSHNYFSHQIKDLHFVDPENFNYKLSAASPIINKGKDVSSYNITKDFHGNDRPQDGDYDIGATEYQPSGWRQWLKKYLFF